MRRYRHAKSISFTIALIIIISVVTVYNLPLTKETSFVYEFYDAETKLILLTEGQQLNGVEIIDWQYKKVIERQPKTSMFYTQDTENILNSQIEIIPFLTNPYEIEILKVGQSDKIRLYVPKTFYKTETDVTYEYTTTYLKVKLDIEETVKATVRADYNTQAFSTYLVITNETLWPVFNDFYKDWKVANDQKVGSMTIVNISDIIANTTYWVNGTYGDATNATGGNPWVEDGKEITNNWSIFNDTQAQIRNFIRFATDGGCEYVLLGGNKDVVPPRMACSYASGTGCASYDNDVSHASDMYYGCLHYCMNNNTNSYFMENECCSYAWDEVDWGFDVLVGRACCARPTELYNWINKTKAYVDGNNVLNGQYLKRNIVACKNIANSISNQTWTGWWAAEGMFGPSVGDEFASNMTFVNGQNISQAQWIVMDDYVNGDVYGWDGINIIYHAGHGGTLYNTLGGCYNPSLCNNPSTSEFVYTEGCHTGDFGTDTTSRAENWISYNGTYSLISNSAWGWFVASTYFGEEMMSRMFNTTRGVNELNFLQAHNDARETEGHSAADGVFAMIFKETNYLGDPALDWVWYQPSYSPSTDANQIISIDNGTNGTTIYDKTPTFNWTNVTNASQYNLLIATDSAFTSITVNLTNISEVFYPTYYSENETNVSFILPISYALPSYGTYYVRVRANTR